LLLGKKSSDASKQSIDCSRVSQNHSGPYKNSNNNRKPKSARGRGRAKIFQQDKNCLFKDQDVGMRQGQERSFVQDPGSSKIEKNMYGIQGGENRVGGQDFEYLDSSTASVAKSGKQQCSDGQIDSKRFQRKQEVAAAGESWEDEPFTKEEMKGALT
jgi:hypothetical protein